MSSVEIICENEHFHVNSDELQCSRYLKRVVCKNEIVTKISLPIFPEIMCKILKFMKLYKTSPNGDWIRMFVLECNDLDKIIEASNFLEIDVLTDIIVNMINESIIKINTVEKVFLFSNNR